MIRAEATETFKALRQVCITTPAADLDVWFEASLHECPLDVAQQLLEKFRDRPFPTPAEFNAAVREAQNVTAPSVYVSPEQRALEWIRKIREDNNLPANPVRF